MEKEQRVIVMVRHGETEWTRTGQHTGRMDLPLTVAGRADAERVRSRLAGFSFSRVFVSPLQRAEQTCHLAGFGPRAEVRPDLMEWDYGDYQGRTLKDVMGIRPGWSLWRDGCPDGESLAEVGERADRILAEVATVDGHVALFAHGHLLRVLAARRIGLSADAGALFTLAPTSVSILARERGNDVISLWNDVSHLERH